MSKSPFALLRELLPSRSSATRSNPSRQDARRLLFESLERRELLSVTVLSDFSVSSNTGEKPQSKVWEYNDQWYAVMPDNSGTWVWKLDGDSWQHHLQLSGDNGVNADVKVDGDLAHILLYAGTQSQLATIQYDNGADNRYEMWALRPSLVNVSLSSGVETATLDLDSTGRLWIASDVKSTIEVRYADSGTQFTNWSAPITIASGISSDDICSIIAMPNGRIGVMWSNQNSDRFGFRTHIDGTAPTQWTADEIPASQSALNKGGGMADDHINLAVASDGTLYAAVKTSYDSSSYPEIALLVRRSSGVWDNLYQVDTKGTRPIVMINEVAGKLIVAYTSSDGGGNIYFKESSLHTISFGSRQTLMSGSLNNVSSVKGTFSGEVVAIASSSSKVKSVVFRFDVPVTNLPPTVNAGADQTIQSSTAATLSGIVTDDGKTNPTPSLLWSVASGPGSVTFADATSASTTATFSAAGTYVLRLTANDGQLSASDTVTIVVEPPPGSGSSNQPPIVNAGSNQTIQLPSLANLSATVTDTDGPLATPTITWSTVSGPGTVTFGNPASTTTTAQFSTAGTYVLRISAFDGQYTSYSDVTITVQAAPTTTTTNPLRKRRR